MPTDGATFAARATVPLSAAVSADASTVRSVAFYANDAVIGTATSSPYSLNWTNPAAGTYRVLAVATDNGGRTSASNPATIVVGSR